MNTKKAEKTDLDFYLKAPAFTGAFCFKVGLYNIRNIIIDFWFFSVIMLIYPPKKEVTFFAYYG